MVIKKSVSNGVSKVDKDFVFIYRLMITGLIIGFVMAIMNVIFKDRMARGFAVMGISLNPIVFLIAGLIGITMSVMIYLESLKIKKAPSKKEFKMTIIYSVIGFFTSMGIGAILVFIGAIIGIKKLKKH